MLLKTLLLLTVVLFSAFSLIAFVVHEQHAIGRGGEGSPQDRYLRRKFNLFFPNATETASPAQAHGSADPPSLEPGAAAIKPGSQWAGRPTRPASPESLDTLMAAVLDGVSAKEEAERADENPAEPERETEYRPVTPPNKDEESEITKVTDDDALEKGLVIAAEDHAEHERVGSLTCNGKATQSEVIYWKVVPGDNEFESPITPHHGIHHDRYLTFEYDNGGWNNMRMAIECLIVCAHAMGRTVVLPPYQNLYLISAQHKDKHDVKAHSQMGFEDFFALDILRTHKGFHVITMKEFLEKEALTGGLHGEFPPGNTSDAWGQPLWRYFEKVADEKPAWGGVFIAFPDRPGDFNFSGKHHPRVFERMKRFGGPDRRPVYYEEKLQKAHHLHFPGSSQYRVLQHHYAFTFFASPAMQSFYKRFIRDYMRYRDEIQCLGHELVQAVREDARASGVPSGDYYALHIRRGDFQFKDVKLQASDIIKQLHVDGKPIIPAGSVVYISTDDPDGVCKDCRVNRKPCEEYEIENRPPGCPKDPSWKAFAEYGWKIRFLKDYLDRPFLKDSNTNVHGMVESIVCSRAKAFAGTWFSTFTGYIHRLRGYHGLGEMTYYHTPGRVTQPRSPQSVGHGFSREWRAGWTDDAGELV